MKLDEITLKDLDSVSFSYFDSVVDGNNFSYDYKLKKGLSKQKLGIFILEKEGIFDLLNN